MSLASVDGALSPIADARIPVTDEGLLRGDGAFEVVRLYGGRPYALAEHLARLRATAAGLRLEVEWAALEAELAALLAAAGPVDALLRVVLTRGGRRLGLIEPTPRHAAVVRVGTVTYAPNRVLDGLKTLSYAGNMLATRLARAEGHDEALLVSPHGRVLEGATWSLFWVDGEGTLRTPPLEERILASITRAKVLQDAEVVEGSCTLAELAQAREAFVASSVREVLPIAAIDGRALPLAPGPATRAAAASLARRIARELDAG